jgi:hypothetical protein
MPNKNYTEVNPFTYADCYETPDFLYLQHYVPETFEEC